MNDSGLAPRWASPPGATISAALQERGMGLAELQRSLVISQREMRDLLDGVFPITISLARSLSRVLGGSMEFWMAREAQYRDDQVRVAADQWAQSLPTTQMASWGWIDQPDTWQERIGTCLQFFGVEDVDAYEDRFGRELTAAHFRASETFPLESGATAAWFRAGERAADQIEGLRDFDSAAFEKVLPEVKRLTRRARIELALPDLTALCASTGVAVVVVRAPRGCSASGAARSFRGRPLIQLSGRHLTDDHLWFSFFHEAGHVLKHGRRGTFIDVLDQGPADALELEANQFAGALLGSERIASQGELGYRDIVRVAEEIGIAPGLVVGQLQHREVVARNAHNRLKRRYRWRGASLETVRSD